VKIASTISSTPALLKLQLRINCIAICCPTATTTNTLSTMVNAFRCEKRQRPSERGTRGRKKSTWSKVKSQHTKRSFKTKSCLLALKQDTCGFWLCFGRLHRCQCKQLRERERGGQSMPKRRSFQSRSIERQKASQTHDERHCERRASDSDSLASDTLVLNCWTRTTRIKRVAAEKANGEKE
jgi:hypothetical protein